MKELASHPTVKPLPWSPTHSSIVRSAVMSSWTSLPAPAPLFLAAEKIGRTGYGMEYEPRYVDVAIQRWQSLTKLEATLEGDGRAFEEIAAGS